MESCTYQTPQSDKLPHWRPREAACREKRGKKKETLSFAIDDKLNDTISDLADMVSFNVGLYMHAGTHVRAM